MNTLGFKVQFGCGLSAPEGWLNFDSSPTLRIQRLPLVGKALTRGRVRFPPTVRYGDVLRRLPLADESATHLYCSHVLEHLSLEDCRKALREGCRVLAPGGIFRGVLPDLELLARDYINDSRTDAALGFMTSSMLGRKRRGRGISGLASHVLGNSFHLWMWDFKSLTVELEAAGFHEVRRAVMGDSGEPAFSVVEDASRWTGCLGFQCCKR
ncbi:MAG: methyltransferase domain-containing protein [Mesorhizobium sp.]|nr:MAG: methyltransferase domain-containing protein [Mesorhizobium sp.]